MRTDNMENLKRATIVGETTAGGAHPGGIKLRLFPLSPTYLVPKDDSELQVEFVVDPEGKEYEAIGYFCDGGKQRLSRVKENC